MAAVSISMGVMQPLLEKLATLMGDEYKKLKGLRKEVSFLKRELSDMNAVLEKMDDADELDPQAKNWRKDIIEMSYDIENYIDNFMDRVGEADNNVGALRKASNYLRTFKDRRRLANQFQDIKTLVIEAGERRKRYMLDQCVSSTTHVTVDPRLSSLYQKSANLVGIDIQKEEIVRWIIDGGQQLKVMSIVGFGGLGKTTLANEVYREVDGKFSHKAFVSISQKPDIIKLLNSLILQLGLQPYSHPCEPQDLINNIIKHLQDKRYLIVVDDLWDTRAWNTISCAFPQNNQHSRVMITTRIGNVARACCGNHGFIHDMKPLSEVDSKKLFFNRICESEDACPPDFIDVSCKILKKCGGLPLAIITMASIIACQPTRSKQQLVEYIQKFLGAEFARNTTYEDMIHIIDFSYKNLPRHLKACFLYLGTYPEDHKINRAELARRWVAEGFVSCSRRQDVWDVAESYFSELVNRGMIQPAYDDFDNAEIEVTHCRVHDMMLELILRKCREDNFISFIVAPKMMHEGQDKVMRRLNIDIRDVQCSITVTASTKHLSQVRSLSIFSGNCRIPNLTEFKFMRLLFLDVNNFQTAIDLTGINRLSQLRYLGIRGPGSMVLLPSQIRGLQFLDTLDLSKMSDYCCLPEFSDVPCLSHVFVPWTWRLPDGIGKVKSLLTLRSFNLAISSLESISGLGELTTLSELTINWTTDSKGVLSSLIDALITSLQKLHKLRHLCLSSSRAVYCGDAVMGSSFLPPFRKVERLNLGILIFSSIPRWIDHLCYLCELLLCAKQMHQEDMNMIGTKLTSLVSLVLRISGVPRERIVIGGSTGFKDLKRFELDCDGSPCMAFEEGAMPDLQELELAIALEKWDKGTPTGLQHLPSLKRIKVCTAKTGDAVTTKQMSATAALMRGLFQKATDALPSRSTVNIDNAWSWIRQMKAFRSSTNDPRQQFQAQAQAMLIAQAQDHYTVEPSWRRKLS